MQTSTRQKYRAESHLAIAFQILSPRKRETIQKSTKKSLAYKRCFNEKIISLLARLLGKLKSEKKTLSFLAYTMAENRRFTTQMIARNMLKKIFVSLFLSVILIITVTI